MGRIVHVQLQPVHPHLEQGLGVSQARHSRVERVVKTPTSYDLEAFCYFVDKWNGL